MMSQHFMANKWGEKWKQWQILFSWTPKLLWMVTATMKLKDTCSLEEKLWQLRQLIKKQKHHFDHQGLSSQSYGFSNSCVRMYVLNHKESWSPKNWCFQTVALEKTLESPLDCKHIKPISPKRKQPLVFIGRTDTEAEAPIFGHLMQRVNSLKETLMLWKLESKRSRWQRMRWLDSITNSKDMNLSKLQEVVDYRKAWPGVVHSVAKNWMWPNFNQMIYPKCLT